MNSVAVIGARGHTGSALLPLIHLHPDFNLIAVGSRSAAGSLVRETFEHMEDCELRFTAITPADIADVSADAFVLALPNGIAGDFVAALDDSGSESVVVDLSADFRFNPSWTYGQPERFGAAICGSKRIANPGCYATGAQLALAPIIDELKSTPVVFGVSGYSGAGTTPSRNNDLDVLRDNFLPYRLADHIHEREVSLHLGERIRFHPHVASFFRGISLTVSAETDQSMTARSLFERYRNYYSKNDLIKVEQGIPEVTAVRNTHDVIIGGFTVSEQHPGSIAVVAVLDNLLKGAATQVIQNLNLAFHLEPERGLTHG